MEPGTLFRIELKYCERCGGLFLRHEDNPQVFCVTCNPLMAKVALKKQPVSVKAAAASLEPVCV